MTGLVLASSNPGKLEEMQALLGPLGFELHPQSRWQIPDATEDGLTFLENALIKARHAARHSGLPALGDDSGLVVAALGGQPGIFSARYAGPGASAADNNTRLLEALEKVPAGQRQAFFYCAMVLVQSATDPAPLVATGRWRGQILSKARGSGGFGYDPLFEIPVLGCSAAELEAGHKNRISHRGQALQSIISQLQA